MRTRTTCRVSAPWTGSPCSGSWMRTYLTDEIGAPRLGAGLLTSRIWAIITAPTWGSVLPHELTMHKVTTPVARQAVAQHGEGTSKQTRRSRRPLQGAPG